MMHHDADHLNFFRRLEMENGDLVGMSHAFFGKTHVETMLEEDLARFMCESDEVNVKELHGWLDANNDGQVCARDFDEKVLKPLFAEQLSNRCSPHCNFLAMMAKELPQECREKGLLDCLAGLEEDEIEDCVNRALPVFVTAFAGLCTQIREMAVQTPIASVQYQDNDSELDEEDEDEDEDEDADEGEVMDLGELDDSEGDNREEQAEEEGARARVGVEEEGEIAGGETDISITSTVVNERKAGSRRKAKEQDEDDSFRDCRKSEVLAGGKAGSNAIEEKHESVSKVDLRTDDDEAGQERELEGMLAKHDWRLKRLQQHQRNVQRLLEAALEVVSEEWAEQLLVDATLEVSQAAQELQQVVAHGEPEPAAVHT